MQDRNFDDLVHKFKTHIYGSPKGAIRLAVLQRDIDTALKGMSSNISLNILDAGAGAGLFSSRFAEKGHRITLCDISAAMLDLAREEYRKAAPNAEARFIHGPIQQLSQSVTDPYDIVFVHAVLEWLAEPQLVLQGLLERVKPGGLISVLFYNRHGLVMQNLILGNLARIRKDELAGWGDSLTPINPLDTQEVIDWFSTDDFEQLSFSGVRCFYDFMPPWVREKKSLEELIEVEMSLNQIEAYRSTARYQHVVYRRKN
ncbi:MAG: tRNA uridine 5-oxyacetic acid(34) methyltransferase CmoM [Thiothrix sp.]|nr:MAG: tRNA uridine 5-oxyacetic acid(34) methyltransferase CmoM [Thiothrix sp.]